MPGDAFNHLCVYIHIHAKATAQVKDHPSKHHCKCAIALVKCDLVVHHVLLGFYEAIVVKTFKPCSMILLA